MPTILLRPAIESDWNFIAAGEEACIREYAERTWGNWIPQPRSNFEPEIHQIVLSEGDEIGCIALIDEPSALTLEKIFILPSYQNRGVGTLLIKQIIERADASGKPIRLRVLRVNPARRLYERHGFIVTHSTDERHFMSRPISTI